MNHLLKVTNKKIKRKLWLSTTLGSTYSCGSVYICITSSYLPVWRRHPRPPAPPPAAPPACLHSSSVSSCPRRRPASGPGRGRRRPRRPRRLSRLRLRRAGRNVGEVAGAWRWRRRSLEMEKGKLGGGGAWRWRRRSLEKEKEELGNVDEDKDEDADT